MVGEHDEKIQNQKEQHILEGGPVFKSFEDKGQGERG
jgi:hypothetical protein